MIEKMKLVRITGPKDDIDRVTEEYLMKYDIHLENAVVELCDIHDVKSFNENNPYKTIIAKGKEIVSKLDEDWIPSGIEIDKSIAIEIIESAFKKTQEINEKIDNLKIEQKHLEKLLNEIEPFRLLDCDLRKILKFKFIKYRFGKMSLDYYDKIIKYIYENINTVFVECERDNNYVWGIYFVPASTANKVDAVMSALHFERLFIADEYEGTPGLAYQNIRNKLDQITVEVKNQRMEIKKELNQSAGDILEAYKRIEKLNRNFDIRKQAACINESVSKEEFIQLKGFYVLCGWFSKRDAQLFIKEIANDPNILCIDGDEDEKTTLKIPTKLKNPKFLKPFELFIKMYGLPAYNELDPTMFLAITYTLMFGIMFGDVGQGICLVVGGYLLYRYKKMNLAAIISIAGLWSTFFGFMYGSIFGYEEVIDAVWLRPMDNIMKVLITSVVFGVALIIIAMLLHIINAIRERNWEALLFDSNGIAGLVCYGTVVISVMLVFTGHEKPGTILLAILIGLPLLAILLKEPLGRLVEGNKQIFPKGSKVMFFVEASVELFDVILSYATNTISFVRVGAFALSHAGMMGVVFTLAGAANGEGNLMVIIIGNIVVAALEGLVVGIQVLRLEYYEMFSRFFRGTGKAFKSFREVEENQS